MEEGGNEANEALMKVAVRPRNPQKESLHLTSGLLWFVIRLFMCCQGKHERRGAEAVIDLRHSPPTL